MTPRRLRFIKEYPIDLNGKQAAIRAGFSEKTAEQQASRLLRDVKVQDAIAEEMRKRSERTEITQDRVLEELAKIGFADMRKLLRWTGNLPKMDEVVCEETGEVNISVANFVQLFDSDDLPDDVAAAVSEISQTKDGALKVKLHDKHAALVSIGRHLGMFKDKVEHTGKDGGPIETREVSNDALIQEAKRLGIPLDVLGLTGGGEEAGGTRH